MKKKASLEIIEPVVGNSFTVKQYRDPSPQLKKPFWHFHPELELVYVKGGKGKRHIGNHISYYNNGELVLIGSNLPHYGFTDRLTENESETIIQFRADFLGEGFFNIPEMKDIKLLFEKARYGIAFSGRDKYRIGAKMEKLPALQPFEKLHALLDILRDMAGAKRYEILNATGYSFEVNLEDNNRPQIIYRFVENNFLDVISLDMIANEVNMTVPAFCRYFKKLAGKTFTRFVNEYRVVHACKLIAEKKISITEVCYESGFNNFSHFTKVFKEVTGKSPSHYRKAMREMIAIDDMDVSASVQAQ